MGKNVMIPRSSLEKIIELLESIELARLSNFYDYVEVLRNLKMKVQRLELREAYAKIIRADGDDSRHDARIEYLRQKSQLGNVYVDDGCDF